MNIHILLLYYRRSRFLSNALNSIIDEGDTYPYWEKVTVIDDTPSDSKFDGERASDFLWEPGEVWGYWNDMLGLRVIEVGDSLEQKEEQGGSRMGWGMQKAVEEVDSDLVMMLCDDDCIYPGFFNHAVDYFTDNPDTPWAYGYAMKYDADNNPVWPDFDELGLFHPTDTNEPYKTKVPAPNHLDISQVIWRRDAQLDYDVEFPYPIHPKEQPLDYWFYKEMEKYHGDCPPIGEIAQYKGQHKDQVSKS